MTEPRARPLHLVTTPEGLVLPFQLAPLGGRAGAFLIDLLAILCGMVAVWLIAAAAALGGAAGLGVAAAVVASFLLRSFYFVVCEVNWGGKTLGKRILGLRVIARDGGPLTAEAVMARNLMREAEFFLPATLLLTAPLLAREIPLPGWALAAASAWIFVFALLPAFGKEGLRCGDLVAGTLVVRAPRVVLLPDLAAAVRAAGGAPDRMPGSAASPGAPPGDEPRFSREQLDIYGIRELQVLEDVLRRDAEGTLSHQMLEEVAERIKAKIGWQREERRLPDLADSATLPFLQAFYRAQRARLEQKLLFGERREKKRES